MNICRGLVKSYSATSCWSIMDNLPLEAGNRANQPSSTAFPVILSLQESSNLCLLSHHQLGQGLSPTEAAMMLHVPQEEDEETALGTWCQHWYSNLLSTCSQTLAGSQSCRWRLPQQPPISQRNHKKIFGTAKFSSLQPILPSVFQQLVGGYLSLFLWLVSITGASRFSPSDSGLYLWPATDWHFKVASNLVCITLSCERLKELNH